jgi:DNA-binding transcriptional MerR regulator
MSSMMTMFAVQPFTPDEHAIYNLDEAAHLATLPRHFVLVCCKHGLVAPIVDSAYGGLFFDYPAIRTLQRIGYLRRDCGVNLPGIKIIVELMDEIERLRTAHAGAGR